MVDDAYKVKQTQDRNWLKAQSKVTSQCALFSNYSRNPEIPGICNITIFMRKLKYPSTTKRPVKHLKDNCAHNLAYFQKMFMKKMKEVKHFTKLTKQKFEELEMALLNSSGKNNGNYNENSPLREW